MKKIGMIIIVSVMTVCLCACGKKNDSTLDKIVHNYKESKSGEKSIELKTGMKVYIPINTVERITDNNKTMLAVFEEYDIKKGKENYEGSINEDAKHNILGQINDMISETIYEEQEANVIIEADTTNGIIMLTTPIDKLGYLTGKVNEISSLMGVYQSISNKSTLWGVNVEIYTYNDNGEIIKYGSEGINEVDEFSKDRINEVPKSASTGETTEATEESIEDNTEAIEEKITDEVSTTEEIKLDSE